MAVGGLLGLNHNTKKNTSKGFYVSTQFIELRHKYANKSEGRASSFNSLT